MIPQVEVEQINSFPIIDDGKSQIEITSELILVFCFHIQNNMLAQIPLKGVILVRI